MPRFHPDKEPSNRSEKIFRRLLNNQLDDNYTVIQNFVYRFNKDVDLRYGEVDAILVSPNTGIVFIEVKGGTVGSDSSGFYRDKDGKKDYIDFKKEDPFQESERHMHDAMRFLAINRGVAGPKELGVPYSHLVAFPECDFNAGVKYKNMYIDAKLMDDSFESVIVDLAERNTPVGLIDRFDPKNLDFVLECLIGEVRSNPNLQPMLGTVDAKMVALTEQQIDILNNKLSRAIVFGGPGTGKSILAAAKARNLAGAGHRVLLLCYNRALARQMENQVNDKSIRIGAWCEYMYDILREVEPGFASPGPDDAAAAQFYQSTLPDKFIDCVDKNIIDPWRPTAVVLDEGQDFNLELLSAIVSYFPDVKTNPFMVLLDPDQNIFFKSENTDKLYREYVEKEYHIDGTYRVPQAIIDYLGKVLPAEYILHRSYIEDGEVGEKFYSDREEHNRHVADVIKGLNDRKIANREIMLLSFSHLEDSHIGESIGDYAVINARNNYTLPEEILDNQLLYYTVRTSKGLEATAILLVDLPKKKEIVKNPEFARWFYVGATRAKYFLYCFYER